MKKRLLGTLGALALMLGVLTAVSAVSATSASAATRNDCYPYCLLSTASVNVYERKGPSTSYTATYLIPGGQGVDVYCYTTGQSINGDNVWYWTGASGHWGYVSGYNLETGHDPAISRHC